MMPVRTPLLEITDVSIDYRTRAGLVSAVSGVSLRIDEGEAVGLVGESGCGKSTLAMAILGHLGSNGVLTRGNIRFHGADIAKLSGEELRRVRGPGIGMIYQEAMSALNPSLRIGTQLIEVLLVHRDISRAKARTAARSMLAEMQLPDPERIMAAYPHQLSGGQQQRVVIALALLLQPRLLLLDEPTTSLDVTVEAGIVDLLASLRQKHNMAMLFISHNLGLVGQVCDRVAVMYAGEIVEIGDTVSMFSHPRHPYTTGLIRCIPRPDLPRQMQRLVPIRGQVSTSGERSVGCAFGPRCDYFSGGLCDQKPIPLEAVGDGMVRCLRAATVSEQVTQAPRSIEPPVGAETELEVTDLDKTYVIGSRIRRGAVHANQRLNFSARRGQTLAIVGESGCGKSTFARIVMGLTTATGGEIRFEAVDLARLPVEHRSQQLLRQLQMVFQNPDETLNPSYTIGAQIGRAVRKLGVAPKRADVRKRVDALFTMTRLPTTYASRRPRQLSGGQKQRVGIARAFAGSPKLVVADEPVSALDVSVQAAVTELLLDIQRTQDTTLIIISHDLGFVRYIAEDVVVMYLGQVMESGPAESVFQPPYHPYTEALLSAAPSIDPERRGKRVVLTGELPSASSLPVGCPFHTRCHRKLGGICETQRPALQTLSSGHRIACHIQADELTSVTAAAN